MDTPFEGDALSKLIFTTLTDRGMDPAEAKTKLEANPPDWDSFASKFVDDYEDGWM